MAAGPAVIPYAPAPPLAPALPPTLPPLPPEIAFLQGEGVRYGDMFRAGARGRQVGATATRCLLASGLVSGSAYAAFLARRLGAPLVRSATPEGGAGVNMALRQGWLRAHLEGGAPVLLIDAGGPLAPALAAAGRKGARGGMAVASEADFRAILWAAAAPAISRAASATLPVAESARTGLDRRQSIVLAALALVFVAALAAAPMATLTYAPLMLAIPFFAAAILNVAACIQGGATPPAAPETKDAALPTYTVLAPLYRETAVLPSLVAALDGLDYPREKLQILLLLEEGDPETIAAARAMALPPQISVYVAPAGKPGTKPRALNAAMPFVTGELVVVYDAEDRPDSQQLRCAARAFARAGPKVACLQARLAIDNSADSWLTRLFAIEYAALFDVTKAGAAQLWLPIPLGGTSNHFRTALLRDLGGWDAWNVTEDADLGLRLAQRGLVVDDLNSTTWEEAPAEIGLWIKQRTRWLKGWMQTIITHSRAPLAGLRAMGPVNFAAAVAISAGVVIGSMFGPFLMMAAVWRMFTPAFLAGATLTDAIADACVLVLGAAGVISLFLPPVMAVRARRRPDLAPWILLLPLYQLLIAVAAWNAARELVIAPHRWNKTPHGLSRNRQAPPSASSGQKQ